MGGRRSGGGREPCGALLEAGLRLAGSAGAAASTEVPGAKDPLCPAAVPRLPHPTLTIAQGSGLLPSDTVWLEEKPGAA